MSLISRIRWVWDRPECSWRCSKYRATCLHTSLSDAQALSLAMGNPNWKSPKEQAAQAAGRTWNEPFFEKTFRSNRPAGCHPSDCCGDPAVHGDPR